MLSFIVASLWHFLNGHIKQNNSDNRFSFPIHYHIGLLFLILATKIYT